MYDNEAINNIFKLYTPTLEENTHLHYNIMKLTDNNMKLINELNEYKRKYG